jgi:hypothetical protein
VSTRPDRRTLAAAVADAATAVPGVVRLSAGSGVEVGVQFAGGTIHGIALQPEAVVVHVVIDRFPLGAVVEPVRSAAQDALRQLGDPRSVEIVVDDVILEAPEAGSDCTP